MSSESKPIQLDSACLLHDLKDARSRLLALVGDLDDDQMMGPALHTVNPPVWEVGHVGWFQERWILRNLDQRASLRGDSDSLYNSFDVPHDSRWDLVLPTSRATFDYIQRILDLSLERVRSRELTRIEEYFYRLVTYHEDMHGEAIIYTRQRLGYPAPAMLFGRGAPNSATVNSQFRYHDVPVIGGEFLLGALSDSPFVFDNEKWAHSVELAPYSISATPVTNEQFKDFVDDHGYSREEFWSREGWVWREKSRAHHPTYWLFQGADGWFQYWFDQLIPLQPNQPVIHVNWYEAEAYCQWAHRRLPTEAEWEMAASAEMTSDRSALTGSKLKFPWGDAFPAKGLANLNGDMAGVIDVRALSAGDSGVGCRQMIGNVWEWTSDRFWPYPGFLLDPYMEYSAPWFGDHKVLRGGCWATQARLIRNTWRNFYTPDRRDVLAGFRTCPVERQKIRV